jgi:hypothetical protein
MSLPAEDQSAEGEMIAHLGGRTSDRHNYGVRSFILGDRRTLEYESSGLRVAPADGDRDEAAVPQRERFDKIEIAQSSAPHAPP